MDKLLKILSYLLTLMIGAFLGVTLLLYASNTGNVTAGPGASKLEQLAALLDERFIEDVDVTALNDAAAAAMVAATGDRWSHYIPADSYAAHVEQMENAYVGIGVTITTSEEPQGFQIVKVTPGSPAEEAGIQVRDVMVQVDGQNCHTLGQDGTRNLVRGEEGTSVRLTISRDGQLLEMDVERRRVEVPVATYQMLEDNYGLITIANFDSKCFSETKAAIEALMAQGAEGIIFDVRFNPGGYKSELVKLLDYILPEGPLFRSETWDGKTTVDESDGDHIEIPMAVLVNADSYSAAEFFAAAMQEYEYAIIVGQQTTGKGYFQSTYQFTDGSAATVSIGRYRTPNGVDLAGVGITPEVIVEVDEETAAAIYYEELEPQEDPQIQAAISALKNAE